ncbi:rRNA adenine N-6-methyltransferase family protein [Iamia majanohamensis]|uniref:rRNA adenine N-6-methyltransferase family protein n=1 Tax=Iamia majanohamensis TaxID=467976 RepID=A0AAE9YGR1_9ACTN|nr:rRNA adenine N-6-methyltransferase family protein [Iamia majanohamensis]WCO68177.1 rRNA adenine N-6-methyltransferase family protein [Iamia majanohamensis]
MDPARRWGWHQLAEREAARLVASSPIGPGALVLDVGAGTGAITVPLLAVGARVVAVEAHPGRARQLRDRFGDDVVVVRADARDLRLPRRPYHVVGNPPFAVTSALLRRLLQPGSRMVSARVVLQDQAARRWASPSAPGVHRWGRAFDAELGRRVPRRAFRPPPPVDARVLHLDRRR